MKLVSSMEVQPIHCEWWVAMTDTQWLMNGSVGINKWMILWTSGGDEGLDLGPLKYTFYFIFVDLNIKLFLKLQLTDVRAHSNAFC